MKVGQWLLANNFLLSALELLVEAQESGKDDEVEGLKHFFSNTDTFPPEELAKYNPEDGTLPAEIFMLRRLRRITAMHVSASPLTAAELAQRQICSDTQRSGRSAWQ